MFDSIPNYEFSQIINLYHNLLSLPVPRIRTLVPDFIRYRKTQCLKMDEMFTSVPCFQAHTFSLFALCWLWS